MNLKSSIVRDVACLCIPLLIIAGCSSPIENTEVKKLTPKRALGRTTYIDKLNPPEVLEMAAGQRKNVGPFQPVYESIVDGDFGGRAHIDVFTSDNGLPMDDLYSAYAEPSGILWFGTNGGGLSRYDGSRFTNFTISNGLPDNVILSLFGDHLNNLWIGTSTAGVCKYDGRQFTTYDQRHGLPVDGIAGGVKCIAEDDAGRMWFGTRGRGLVCYNQETFTTFTVQDGLKGNYIHDLEVDSHGKLWVATAEGLHYFEDGRFLYVEPENEISLSNIASIVEADSGKLLLGFGNGDLYNFHFSASLGQRFELLEFPGIDNPGISDLVIDSSGTLWISTISAGVIRVIDFLNPIERRYVRLSREQGLTSDNIKLVVCDGNGEQWIITRGGGINQYHGNAFVNFPEVKSASMTEGNQNTLWMGGIESLYRFDGERISELKFGYEARNYLYAIESDESGNVFFAKNLIDPTLAGITSLQGNEFEIRHTAVPLSDSDIFWVEEDRQGDLWTCGRRGVTHYKVRSDNVISAAVTYTKTQGLGSNTTLCLLEDNAGYKWVGTDGGGVSRLTRDSCTTWTTTEGLPNNVVWSITQDQSNAHWIGTLGGLCRFDGKSFLTYSHLQGLPDDNIIQVIVSKVIDPKRVGQSFDGGELIVGTINGIAILTGWRRESGEFIPFKSITGYMSNEELSALTPVFETYNNKTGFPVRDVQTAQGALFEDSEGILWISTASDRNGLTRFSRKDYRKNLEPSIPIITDVSLNNESISWYSLLEKEVDKEQLLQQESLIYDRKLDSLERDSMRRILSGVLFDSIQPNYPVPIGLTIDCEHNQIGFSFRGIETSRPELMAYQYMLDGYDEKWSPVNTSTTATYGNIQEGQYTFKVRARNPFGIWSKAQSFEFVVKPPWYRTWWAYLIFGWIIMAFIYSIIRQRIAILKKQKIRLEALVSERTEQLSLKMAEADMHRNRAELSEQAKQQFLANMSHEIRTPMNAIMGMTGILQRNQHTEEQEKYLKAIKMSSENLLVILNDILDMSKIDAGKIELEKVAFEPRNILGHIKDILHFKFDEKNITFGIETDSQVPEVLVGDPTRLNQVLLNLVGNAIKFTGKGSVMVKMTCSEPLNDQVLLAIEVADTGVGIPESRLEKIFEEFTQAYSDTTRKFGGTGLGLTISKRLAELQGGSITVKSVLGQGSTFTVKIPYNIGTVDMLSAKKAESDLSKFELRDLRVLIAEDNAFNVMVAKDELSVLIPGLRLDVATDGQQAVDFVLKNDYDLILLDIQMPILNGYDVSAKIRSLGGAKSHLPIIALTANVLKEELERCIAAGMNGYVSKPFTGDDLLKGITEVMKSKTNTGSNEN